MRTLHRPSRDVNFRSLFLLFLAFCFGWSFGLVLKDQKSNVILVEKQLNGAVHNPTRNSFQTNREEMDSSFSQYPLSEEQISELLEKVEKSHHAYCRSFFTMENLQTKAQNQQDWWMFANYFYKMGKTPGVFLDIGGNDPVILSNTYFFETCLGWKGVAIEPNSVYWPKYAIRNNTRVVKYCIDVKQSKRKFSVKRLAFGGFADHKEEEAGVVEMLECKSLEDILKENQDILGGKDEYGRYGSKINFISMDIEAFEAPLIGCTDWNQLLSDRAHPQILLVETEHATSKRLRIIDASLNFANFVKVASLLSTVRSYADDVYERQTRKWFPLPYSACVNVSTSTCSFYHASDPIKTFDFKCEE